MTGLRVGCGGEVIGGREKGRKKELTAMWLQPQKVIANL